MNTSQNNFDDIEHIQNIIKTQRKKLQLIEEEYFKTQNVDLLIKLKNEQEVLSDLWARLEKAREKSFSEPEPIGTSEKQSSPSFAFANRVQELGQLTGRDSSHSFFLLEGPSGQGKSYLLEQVLKEFNTTQGIRTFYIDFRKKTITSQTSILAEILSVLDYQRSNLISPDSSMHLLQQRLISFCNDDKWDMSILIFDSVEILDENINKWLRDEVVYKLGTFVPHNKIKVIISGRYIAGADQWMQGSGAHLWKYPPLTLSAFNQKVIVGVIGDFARKKDLPLQHSLEVQNVLAHEIQKIAGGHPDFIIKVLSSIQGDGLLSMKPDMQYCRDYFKNEGKKIFREIVKPNLSNLFTDVHDKVDLLQRAFESLSIFRGFTVTTLKVLMNRNYINGFSTEEELLEHLTRTRIVTMADDAAFFHDQIIRDVLANYMRLEDTEKYKELNNLAIEIYKSWCQGYLIDPRQKMKNPPTGDYLLRLVIEYIYHKLVLLEMQYISSENPDVILKEMDDVINDAFQLLNWSDLESSQGLTRFFRGFEKDDDIRLLITSLVSNDAYYVICSHIKDFKLSDSSKS